MDKFCTLLLTPPNLGGPKQSKECVSDLIRLALAGVAPSRAWREMNSDRLQRRMQGSQKWQQIDNKTWIYGLFSKQECFFAKGNAMYWCYPISLKRTYDWSIKPPPFQPSQSTKRKILRAVYSNPNKPGKSSHQDELER